MYLRVFALLIVAVVTGCNVSTHREKLVSHLPKADGSELKVECTTDVKHQIASISSKLNPQPYVEIILDEQTFAVYSDKVILNEEELGTVSDDVGKVMIVVQEDGVNVTADGYPITKD